MQAKDFSDLFELEDSFWWFQGMRDITRTFLDPELPAGISRNILDAGCGTGANLKFLERYSNGQRVFGIDISPDALSFCKQNGWDLLTCASAIELPFPSSYFDVVTSFDVLVQIPGENADAHAL